MNRNFQKAVPIILSVIGSVGVVGTSILAVKNSKKHSEIEKTNNKKEDIKNFLKCYWPSILCGVATVGSITAGTIISKKTEASLSAGIIMLERGYNKYQGKVKQLLGKEVHENIIRDIAKDEAKELNLPSKDKDGRLLYYNQYIGHFYAKPEDVNRAILNMNMRMHSSPVNTVVKWEEKGKCTLKQFVDDAKAELLDEKIFAGFKDYGWTYEYLSDMCEDEWIYDGYNEQLKDEPETRVLIFMTCEPIYLPNGWDHAEYLLERSEKWHGLIEDDPQSDEEAYKNNISEIVKYLKKCEKEDGDLPPWTTYEFD